MDGNENLNLPGAVWDQSRTLVERLRVSERQPVTVYVTGVHVGMAGAPGAGMGGTLILQGQLAYVGNDYIDVHVMMPAGNIKEVLVPITSIGAVIPGGPIV